MRRTTVLAVVVAAALALAAPTIAQADGVSDGASVSRNVSQTIVYTNPCTGETGTLTITYTLIAQTVTEEFLPTFHFHQTLVGDFLFAADGTMGHFVLHDTFEGVPAGVFVITTEAHGSTADGSRFSLHFATQNLGAPPEVRVSFDHCA